MSENPKISVVIAARNEEQNIAKCISDIPAYSDIEAIVVDDSSEDQTYAIAANSAAEFPIRVYRNKTPRGNTYSWDYGARKAKGELIFLMAADSRVNSFDSAAPHFKDPRIVQVHQTVKIVSGNNLTSKIMPAYQRYVNYLPFVKKGHRKEVQTQNPRVCDSHALMRKSFYLEVDPPTDKSAGEEYRFNEIGKTILKDKDYKTAYEAGFIEERENSFSFRRFLIQQRWYGRNAVAAYGLLDLRTFRKVFRFFLAFFLITLTVSFFGILLPWMAGITAIVGALVILRLAMGIPSLRVEDARYLPAILLFIMIGDLAYAYGFMQSLANRVVQGRWLINK